jgi:hypothetical protein
LPKQCELLPSLGVRRPLTFHILIFSSETAQPNEVKLEKYFDFSLYSHHFSLLSLTSLLSAPEREVTSPSDFKVVGALPGLPHEVHF